MQAPSIMAHLSEGAELRISTVDGPGSGPDVWLSFESVQLHFRGGRPDVALLQQMLTEWLSHEGVLDQRIAL